MHANQLCPCRGMSGRRSGVSGGLPWGEPISGPRSGLKMALMSGMRNGARNMMAKAAASSTLTRYLLKCNVRERGVLGEGQNRLGLGSLKKLVLLLVIFTNCRCPHMTCQQY